MCYSMFQKVIHRSGLPKCADIIVLAEVGLPTLISSASPPPPPPPQIQAESKQMTKFSIALFVLQQYLVLSQMLGN